MVWGKLPLMKFNSHCRVHVRGFRCSCPRLPVFMSEASGVHVRGFRCSCPRLPVFMSEASGVHVRGFRCSCPRLPVFHFPTNLHFQQFVSQIPPPINIIIFLPQYSFNIINAIGILAPIANTFFIQFILFLKYFDFVLNL